MMIALRVALLALFVVVGVVAAVVGVVVCLCLSVIHISGPTRQAVTS